MDVNNVMYDGKWTQCLGWNVMGYVMMNVCLLAFLNQVVEDMAKSEPSQAVINRLRMDNRLMWKNMP